MARATGISAEQLRTLDRLRSIAPRRQFYLAGGAAISFHLEHRRSNDLDLFGPARASFAPFQALAKKNLDIVVLDVSDATLRMRVANVPVDFVRYPYPLLEEALPGPAGFAVATLLDLGTMKLSALAKRGLARDFWDLYAIVQSGITLENILAAYTERFAMAEADTYHVLRALTWFEDADAEQPRPVGLTPPLWRRIESFFRAEGEQLLTRFVRGARRR